MVQGEIGLLADPPPETKGEADQLALELVRRHATRRGVAGPHLPRANDARESAHRRRRLVSSMTVGRPAERAAIL